MKSCLRLAVVLASAAAASVARAQSASDLERARSLFDEAGELERRGDYTTAQDRLREAVRIRETPHLRYALGWALENDDALVEARGEYELAIRLAERTGADEVRRLAAARLFELERITPVLQIRLALPARDRVTVDDRGVAVRGDVAATAVDPGTHRVRVARLGGGSFEQRVFVPRATARVLDVRNVRFGGSSSATTLPWVLVGGGAALVLGGVGLVAWSQADASARDDKLARWCEATACTNGHVATLPESPAAAQLRTGAANDASRGNTKQIAGAVLGGAGLVTLGVGVYMLVRARTTRDERGLDMAASPMPGSAAGFAQLRF
jgi:hypothetical protein